MPEYIVRIEGKLSPPPSVKYENFTEELPSFSINIEKEVVNAVPRSNISPEETDVTLRCLQDEISPLLTVFGSVEGRTITLEITNIVYPTLKRLSTQVWVTYTISGQIPTLMEMHQKIHWASVDPIYRDLLNFYTEALAAPNPRPTGTKMVERLKVKFKGYDNALTSLGMPENGFALIKQNQSKYQGDRHADYKVGYVPARLGSTERNEVLAVLKHIIHEYENRICATTIS